MRCRMVNCWVDLWLTHLDVRRWLVLLNNRLVSVGLRGSRSRWWRRGRRDMGRLYLDWNRLWDWMSLWVDLHWNWLGHMVGHCP